MEATLARAKENKSCANCAKDLFPADFVAIDGAKVFCLNCFMSENNLTPKQFSKVLKSVIGCENCGFSKSAFALQFDHIDHSTKYKTKSGKKINPSDLFYSCAVAVFVAEVAKCVIRCANCHAIKTAKERGLE